MRRGIYCERIFHLAHINFHFMSLYTRRGDKGETDLLKGVRTDKDSLRIGVIGTLDELCSLLGLVRTKCQLTNVSEAIIYLQKTLFEMGALLAGHEGATIPPAKTLEDVIDELEKLLPPMRHFILPGGHEGAALLHHARSVCRRAERLVVALQKKETVDENVLIFLNRMSDLLFALARYVNHTYMLQDQVWEGVPNEKSKKEKATQEVEIQEMEFAEKTA